MLAISTFYHSSLLGAEQVNPNAETSDKTGIWQEQSIYFKALKSLEKLKLITGAWISSWETRAEAWSQSWEAQASWGKGSRSRAESVEIGQSRIPRQGSRANKTKDRRQETQTGSRAGNKQAGLVLGKQATARKLINPGENALKCRLSRDYILAELNWNGLQIYSDSSTPVSLHYHTQRERKEERATGKMATGRETQD